METNRSPRHDEQPQALWDEVKRPTTRRWPQPSKRKHEPQRLVGLVS